MSKILKAIMVTVLVIAGLGVVAQPAHAAVEWRCTGPTPEYTSNRFPGFWVNATWGRIRVCMSLRGGAPFTLVGDVQDIKTDGSCVHAAKRESSRAPYVTIPGSTSCGEVQHFTTVLRTSFDPGPVRIYKDVTGAFKTIYL